MHLYHIQYKYICKCKKSNSCEKEGHVHFGVGFMGTKMIVYYKEECLLWNIYSHMSCKNNSPLD